MPKKNSKNDVLVQNADFNFCSSKAPNKAYNKANVHSMLYKFDNKDIFTSEIRMLEKFHTKNQQCQRSVLAWDVGYSLSILETALLNVNHCGWFNDNISKANSQLHNP